MLNKLNPEDLFLIYTFNPNKTELHYDNSCENLTRYIKYVTLLGQPS